MNASNSIDIGTFVRDWFAAATERRELLALEDRMRRDVGLTEADIHYLVRRPSLPAQEPHTLVRPGDFDPAQIPVYVERAHALRAQAYRNLFRAIGRWLRA